MIPGYEFSLDFIRMDDPWIGVDPDMGALRRGNAKRDTLSHTTLAPLHTEVRHSRECVANDHFHSRSTAGQIPVI